MRGVYSRVLPLEELEADARIRDVLVEERGLGRRLKLGFPVVLDRVERLILSSRHLVFELALVVCLVVRRVREYHVDPVFHRQYK